MEDEPRPNLATNRTRAQNIVIPTWALHTGEKGSIRCVQHSDGTWTFYPPRGPRQGVRALPEDLEAFALAVLAHRIKSTLLLTE